MDASQEHRDVTGRTAELRVVQREQQPEFRLQLPADEGVHRERFHASGSVHLADGNWQVCDLCGANRSGGMICLQVCFWTGRGSGAWSRCLPGVGTMFLFKECWGEWHNRGGCPSPVVL